MEYIRIKIQQGNATSSQIIPKDKLDEYILNNPIMGYINDDCKITFSPVKKSPLLTYKKNI